MSDKTNISYCDHTKSPWRGCEKKSAGCAGCYVEDFQRKFGDKLTDRRLVKSFEADVMRWNRKSLICDDCGKGIDGEVQMPSVESPSLIWCSDCHDYNSVHRPRVFVSLCDWLDDKVPVEWLADFLRVIHETPNLDWLVCTKRPENWQIRLDHAIPSIDGPSTWAAAWLHGEPPHNIWFGVTCEDQASADERIALLLQIPAKVRWVSAEPLLEPISFAGCPGTIRDLVQASLNQEACEHFDTANLRGVDWVVVGGQSGPKRRDCGVEPIIDVAKQCAAAGVPCFVKQDCAARPGQQGRIPDAYWSLKQFPRSNGGGLLKRHGD